MFTIRASKYYNEFTPLSGRIKMVINIGVIY